MKIAVSYNQLLTYEDNDLCLFKTPPSSYYWASHPRFQDDEYVASPSDFLHGDDYDLCLFKTPPSSYYWASHPRFQDDEYVASPSDFLHGDDFCRDDDYLEAFGEKTHSLDIE